MYNIITIILVNDWTMLILINDRPMGCTDFALAKNDHDYVPSFNTIGHAHVVHYNFVVEHLYVVNVNLLMQHNLDYLDPFVHWLIAAIPDK